MEHIAVTAEESNRVYNITSLEPNKPYRIPYKCFLCGNIYLSEHEHLGKMIMSFKGKAISYLSSKCPKCNNEFFNIWKPDLIEFIEKCISDFSKLSLEQLLKMQLVAKSNLKPNLTESDFKFFKGEFQKETPELQSIKDLLPKTRAEAYAFIAIIISILAIVIPLLQNTDKPITNISYKTVINQTDTANKVKQDTIKRTLYPVASKNKPCPCGSGKLYKRCHGKEEAE